MESAAGQLLLPRSFWPSTCRLLTGEAWHAIGATGAAVLVERCSSHGLLPLLFAAPQPPLAVGRALEAARGWERILRIRARWFREATTAVCDALAGEPLMLIKGADYARRLYPSPVLRPMQDIDLLVPAGRMDAVCDRLLAAGMARQPAFGAARDAAHHERVFFHGRILVEVHQSFIQRARHRVDYEGVWQRAVPFEVEGRQVLRLDNVDALLYHALSMSIDQFNARLVRYVDLWLLLARGPDIAATAAARARDWRTARALYGALSLGCRLCPEFATADVRSAMDLLLPAATRRFLERWVLPGAAEVGQSVPPRRGAQLWRKACLMDSTGHALAFALSHAAASWRHRAAVAKL
ncbi:MAG TPA: nucleotidyltransferase family protein [Ramlibacter sp.]|nr:nucleotidyltransferase family protein [Ramlibacter sp.]